MSLVTQPWFLRPLICCCVSVSQLLCGQVNRSSVSFWSQVKIVLSMQTCGPKANSTVGKERISVTTTLVSFTFEWFLLPWLDYYFLFTECANTLILCDQPSQVAYNWIMGEKWYTMFIIFALFWNIKSIVKYFQIWISIVRNHKKFKWLLFPTKICNFTKCSFFRNFFFSHYSLSDYLSYFIAITASVVLRHSSHCSIDLVGVSLLDLMASSLYLCFLSHTFSCCDSQQWADVWKHG